MLNKSVTNDDFVQLKCLMFIANLFILNKGVTNAIFVQ